MTWKNLCCALVLTVLLPFGLHAQSTGQISGIVTSDGQPLAGAQVTVQGTQLRGVSSADGRYTIAGVPAGRHTLTTAIVGYAATEQVVTVTAGATATANFELAVRATILDDLVVVGYGTQRREQVTGAVASVTSDQFIQGPARDAASMIAGRVPGLSVTMPSGNPRAGSEINLRGVTTIQGNRNPLVLIDGVPGTLSTVAPQDIDQITVLRDGSAAAIYGSRASNGVILITTKRHEGGSPTIRYDGYLSTQTLYNQPDFLTAGDYRRLIGEGYGFEDLGHETDWLAQVRRGNPLGHRHNVTISGGLPNTNYNASFNYESTEGIFIRSDNRELTGRANIRHSMYDGRLEADINLLTRTQNYYSPNIFNGAWRQTLIRNPTDRVRDDDGGWQERGVYMYVNPVAQIMENNGEFEGRNTRMHGTLTFRPVNTLRLSAMGGTTRGSSINGTATTFRHSSATQNNIMGQAFRSTGSTVNQIMELTGTWDGAIANHSFSLLGGYSYLYNVEENFNASNSGFPTDLFGWNSLGSGSFLTEGRASMGSNKEDFSTIGFFSRLNYNWGSRFNVMGSVRYEGDSRFGAEHKWGIFPALSAGWRISEERFMDALPAVSDLRLRAGYGVTGIAPNDPYLSLTSYSYQTANRFFYNNQWIQGLGPARNANPNLRWEEKHEINVGLDFALFDFRLNGGVDAYRRDTRDMLYNYSVPVPPFLTNTILANVGHMRNNGIEAQLNFDVLRGSRLRWNTGANWSTNNNKLVTLSDDTFQPQNDCYVTGGTGEPIQQSTHQVCVGQRIGNFYGFKSVDIDDKGEWVVLNAAGEPIPIRGITQADRHVLGNGLPKQYLAWNNDVQFGNLDFNVNMRGAFGFQNLNYLRMYYENPTILHYNMLRSAFDPVYGKRPVNYDLAYVSYYIEDGDYWKIDNATLGYTVAPAMLARFGNTLTSARVYVSGRNLHTFTGYKGLDPEVSTTGLTPGIDSRDTYPTTRTFTFGATITF